MIHCERFKRISSSSFDRGLFFVSDINDDATVSVMMIMDGLVNAARRTLLEIPVVGTSFG